MLGPEFHYNIDSYRELRSQSELPKFLDPNTKRKFPKTLILDLDETLVHSSFAPVDDAEIVLPIPVENNICNVYVQIRPGARYFLEEASKNFEVVIFTASLSKYAEPLMYKLDPDEV